MCTEVTVNGMNASHVHFVYNYAYSYWVHAVWATVRFHITPTIHSTGNC